MPFGKRGLTQNEFEKQEAELRAAMPVMPRNPTTIQWLVCVWKLCRVAPCGFGQGFISFGYHVFASVSLAIATLFVSADALTRLSTALSPYWPLLDRVRPYMDAHGRHQLYLYACATFFKDMVLIILFLIRNLIWLTYSFWSIGRRTKIRFQPKTYWMGLIALPALAFLFLSQLYYGPKTPNFMLLGSVYYGNIYKGLLFPSLLMYPMLVLFCYYSAYLVFFPGDFGDPEGGKAKLKQMGILK